eukprot:GFYU01074879.1.p1 GENE.GFYU01074879.1~~GFYU01074879.1.p1  ORF type:complete len:176 (-),score=26.52 GFYU01074879.1:12-464(-)
MFTICADGKIGLWDLKHCTRKSALRVGSWKKSENLGKICATEVLWSQAVNDDLASHKIAIVLGDCKGIVRVIELRLNPLGRIARPDAPIQTLGQLEHAKRGRVIKIKKVPGWEGFVSCTEHGEVRMWTYGRKSSAAYAEPDPKRRKRFLW